nr:BA14K family protein [Jiella mangrovi]
MLALGSVGTSTVSAQAEPYWRVQHHDGHHWRRGHAPRHYRHGRHHRRDRYYGRRHHNNGAAIGAGIAGLAIGAIVGGALAERDRPVPLHRVYPSRGGSHVARCRARYRSYDARTDTFLGYDGYRHRCRY